MSELQVSDLDERVRLLTGQLTIANEILRAPVSILPLPSQWIASAAIQGELALHYRQVADGR